MACKVCGEAETVRVHILPSAFWPGIMDDDRKVYIARAGEKRIRISETGLFDKDLLCAGCEDSLKDCDDYAIRWVRSFSKRAKRMQNVPIWKVPNPKPALLVKFVASVIWRSAMAPSLGDGIDLGPWETELRSSIFGGADYEPRVVVIRTSWRLPSIANAKIGVGVTHAPAWSEYSFFFEAAEFRWAAKLDRAQKAGSFFRSPLLANSSDPIWVLAPPQRNLEKEQTLMRLFNNVEQASKR